MDLTATQMPFGPLLRRYRIAASLSQEALAERACLSTQAVSALERGERRAPYRSTVELLAGALSLAADERANLRAAVSRRRRPADRSVATIDPSRSNLPTPVTSFVGREAESATLRRLLESSRLVTLTGTGGAGKTRLSTHVAAGLVKQYADGVWLVELAALADPARVPQAVALALGVREEPGRPLAATLEAALREKELLILLDNCEHLRDGAASIAEALLRAAPSVRILATSRTALGLAHELVWPVPSLAVPEAPDRNGRSSPAIAQAVARSESVQLFCARAAVAQPAFALSDANAAAVAAICRRLDGIPLAIELAAARTRILTPEQIAARLDARFALLSRNDPELPPRQQSLRAALDWSHDLLTEPERRLLRRLSVFAGACESDAVEAVCAGDGVDAHALFDLLMSLTGKSLLTVEHHGEAARYRLLETVRQYAARKLEESGEGAARHRAHRDCYLEFSHHIRGQEIAQRQPAPPQQLEREHDNLRAALRWSFDQEGEAEAGLRLALNLWRFWERRGYLEEGRTWLAQALARAIDVPSGLRADLLDASARLAYVHGEPETASRYGREMGAICREIGDRSGEAAALRHIESAALERRDYAVARAAIEQRIGLLREVEDRPGIAACTMDLGFIAGMECDYARAVELLEEGLALLSGLPVSRSAIQGTRHLANILRITGEYERARVRAEQNLALSRELGDRWCIAQALRVLGHIASAEGEVARAAALYEQSLNEHREVGVPQSIAEGQCFFGGALARLGDLMRAEPLLQESLTSCRRIPYEVFPPVVLRTLGYAARVRGDLKRAAGYYAQSLEALRKGGDQDEIVLALEGLATARGALGRAEQATRLLGAAQAYRAAAGRPLPPAERPDQDATLTTLRDALGEAGLDAALAAGRAMTVAEAMDFALDPCPARARAGVPQPQPADVPVRPLRARLADRSAQVCYARHRDQP